MGDLSNSSSATSPQITSCRQISLPSVVTHNEFERHEEPPEVLEEVVGFMQPWHSHMRGLSFTPVLACPLVRQSTRSNTPCSSQYTFSHVEL